MVTLLLCKPYLIFIRQFRNAQLGRSCVAHTLLLTTVTPGSCPWCEAQFHLYCALVRTTNELLVDDLETRRRKFCLPVKGQINATRRGKEELSSVAAKQEQKVHWGHSRTLYGLHSKWLCNFVCHWTQEYLVQASNVLKCVFLFIVLDNIQTTLWWPWGMMTIYFLIHPVNE